MYPVEQLKLLERHKALLRVRIGAQRAEAVYHFTQVAQPLGMISRVQARWQALPLALRMAMGPLALAIQRAMFKRLRVGGSLLLWGPVVWRLAKWALPLLKASRFFHSRPEDRRRRQLQRPQRRAEALARHA